GLPEIPYPSGTAIRFVPDKEIFETTEFDVETIIEHLRQQAFLTRGVKITFLDQREEENPRGWRRLILGEPWVFYFESGVKAYLEYLLAGREALTPVIYFADQVGDIQIEIGLAYTPELKETLYGFANNIFNQEGGMHLTGFRSALTRVISDYAKKNNHQGGNQQKEKLSITGEDVREGLVAVVSVRLPEPQFEGQTKAKLGNPEARTAVESVVTKKLSVYLEENPKVARCILERVLLAARARLAAKAAKETVLRKGLLEGLALPGKLADCASKDPANSELFIVEGDSAGGNAKQARDSFFQAILPIRGKILNVEKARFDRVLKSEEIRALIVALGMGVGEEKDISKIRYHRIILMSDADVDGAHIRTLLLTFFYRFYPEVIERGYLYIAQPPLYKIETGRKVYYAYTEEEKERILRKIKGRYDIQRYKGLGEMNPEQLWETTMNPETRILLRVSMEDAEQADKVFRTLMGESVEDRKKFIQTKAKEVKNLDI
ncbi:DNA topoisomerase IV subunit B, partial [bacterium]|nr:DNA topoisomerase IV subunit B [bacterium]